MAKLCGVGDRPRFCLPRLENCFVGSDRAWLIELELSLVIRFRFSFDFSVFRPSERDRDRRFVFVIARAWNTQQCSATTLVSDTRSGVGSSLLLEPKLADAPLSFTAVIYLTPNLQV